MFKVRAMLGTELSIKFCESRIGNMITLMYSYRSEPSYNKSTNYVFVYICLLLKTVSAIGI